LVRAMDTVSSLPSGMPLSLICTLPMAVSTPVTTTAWSHKRLPFFLATGRWSANYMRVAQVDKAQAQAAQAGPKPRFSARCWRSAPHWPSMPLSCANRSWSKAGTATSHKPGGAGQDAHRPATSNRGKAALGLSNANITVLNGADGLAQVAAGLVSQGVAIFDALRGGVIDHDDDGAPLAGHPKDGS
jgi:hypothetical protein